MARYGLGMNGTYALDCDLSTEIGVCCQAGFEFIELRDWKVADYLREHELVELAALLEESAVMPLAMNTIQPVTLGPGADKDRLRENIIWRCQVAAAVGCRLVVACSHGCPEGLSGKGREWAVKGLQLASAIAAEYGVSIAYEPMGPPAYPIRTIAETMEVLGEMSLANVGWLLDVYHLHTVGDTPDALAEADVSKLLLVHLSDAEEGSLGPGESWRLDSRVFPGDGVIELSEILSVLHASRYEGPFSVELLNARFSSWDPCEFAKVAKEKTERILDAYFREQEQRVQVPNRS